MRAMRRSVAGVAMAVMLFGLSVIALAQETEPAAGMVVDESIVYTGDGFSRLDVYAPGEPGPWPVVVFVHGVSQDRSVVRPLAEAIASQGAVVFNVGASMHGQFTETTRQVACGVRFARATAADYGGDVSSITLVGHSAGAAIGMVVALAGDDYARDCVVAEGSALVDVLVGYEGPFDWATTDYDLINLVQLREEDPDLWRAIDPYAHIGKNPDLVVRLVHGDDADVAWYEIPRAVSIEFAQALRAAGYETDMTLLDDAHHGAVFIRGSEAWDLVAQEALRPAADDD